MRLVFIHGPVASGKLTVARELAAVTGFALFHNHLIVDAVGAVFPFGDERFVRLREQFWLETMREAAEAGRSMIFTFAPEPSVAADFPERAAAVVAAAGGRTDFVRLTVPIAHQEARIDAASRAEFGKLRSLDLLRRLRDDFAASEAAMPPSALVLDTSAVEPGDAAARIIAALGLETPP